MADGTDGVASVRAPLLVDNATAASVALSGAAASSSSSPRSGNSSCATCRRLPAMFD